MTAGARLVIATGHGLSLALVEERTVLAAVDRPGHGVLDRELVPAIAALMDAALEDGARCQRPGSILVDCGPGSFTGVRLGLAAARALGLGWGVDVRGYEGTRLLAEAARARGLRGPLLVALAAPRGQAWVQGFDPEPGPIIAVEPEALDAMVERHRHSGGVAIGSAIAADPEGGELPQARLAALLEPAMLGEPRPVYVSRAAVSLA